MQKKQRLIKLPHGKKMEVKGSGLPNFPDGTIIAKTFYYLYDETNLEKGKRIIETRILIKGGGVWNVGTYLWNETQTDAKFITEGYSTEVDWVDLKGETHHINYQVPDHTACTTCHQKDGVILPIGPKVRLLNTSVKEENGSSNNQLDIMMDIGLFHAFGLDTISSTPNYFNETESISKRGRAYLDINCAHCHSQGGSASNYAFWLDFNFDYETPFNQSNISEVKTSIFNQMHSGKMPLIGTTMIDKEGLDLIKQYINTLN